MIKIIIITSSVIVILLSVYLANQLSTVTIKQDYSHFYLVLHWPGTEGREEEESFSNPTTTTTTTIEKPVHTVHEFKIHGLWPQPIHPKEPGERLTDCDSKLDPKHRTPYDVSKIKDLTTALQAKWPALESPYESGADIWKHEWEKHGTCSKHILVQHAYFTKAIELIEKINILEILAQANIRPDGNSYRFKNINSALTAGIGHPPGIDCIRVKGQADMNLYQVKICVDKKGSEFIECPNWAPPFVDKLNRCDGMVRFPEFPRSSSEDDQL